MMTGLHLGRLAVVSIAANEPGLVINEKENLKRVWSWRTLTSSTFVFLTHSEAYKVNERRLPLTLLVAAIITLKTDYNLLALQ